MNQQTSAPRRFTTLFAESMAIGRKPNGGTDRMALTPDDCAHRSWFVKQLREVGAEVRIDAAGNIFGLFTWDNSAPYILCGSHLDSQENGGVLDGAYGVVAALCAARAVDKAVRAGQLAPKANLAVVDWTNEEGARFEPSLMGSRVFTGSLRLSDVEQAQDLDGVRFDDALREGGWQGTDEPPQAAAYFELHVEQGPVLEAADVSIGAVTGNWAAVKMDMRILGEQSHTGSTPMSLRKDALYGMALLTVAARELADDVARRSIELRTSVTKVQLFPHSPNIVTSECQLHLEIRAESEENAREAAKQLTDRFTEIEAASSTRIKVTGTEMRPSMAFPESGISLIERAATTCGITCVRTKTVCGHDAVALAAHVPTALMFVPSVGSHAHAPNEFTKPEDLANGVRTLEQALRICVANGDFPAEGE